MMVRYFLLVIATLFLFPGGAADGQTPSGKTPSASYSSADDVPKPKMVQPLGEPTSAQLDAARKLVGLMHPEYELSVVLANKLSPLAIRLTLQNPENVERAHAAQEAESKVLKDALPILKSVVVEAYAREMSQKQLDDTLMFLGTPSGLAFSRAQGRIPLYFEIIGADMWGHYTRSMLVEFCARVPCTNKDQELMNGPGR